MKLFETIEQEEKREAKDNEIILRLMESDPSYRNAPTVRSFKIGHRRHSIRWLLYYEQARNAGVSCRYSAQRYAIFCLDCQEWYENYPSIVEEQLILYLAMKYRKEHGWCQALPAPKPKKKKQSERVLQAA